MKPKKNIFAKYVKFRDQYEKFTHDNMIRVLEKVAKKEKGNKND